MSLCVCVCGLPGPVTNWACDEVACFPSQVYSFRVASLAQFADDKYKMAVHLKTPSDFAAKSTNRELGDFCGNLHTCGNLSHKNHSMFSRSAKPLFCFVRSYLEWGPVGRLFKLARTRFRLL